MAIGAQPAEIMHSIVWRGITLVLAGIALGLTASLLLSRLVARLLYDVSPTDPLTLGGVSLLLLLVSLVACYIPARRATRVDPLLALRDQ